MILGIGTDIIEIDRIRAQRENIGDAMVKKHFTPYEQDAFKNTVPSHQNAFIAKRFAAKEAVAKALGTGIRDGIALKDIEIRNDELGKPSIILYAEADKRAKALHENYITHLSLSDEKRYAIAYCTISA